MGMVERLNYFHIPIKKGTASFASASPDVAEGWTHDESTDRRYRDENKQTCGKEVDGRGKLETHAEAELWKVGENIYY